MISSKPRIAWIDLLETIAIFLVILCHNTLYTFDVSAASTPGINYLYYFLRTIQVIGVPLFFLVNGYLLFSKPFNLKRHIFKMLRFIIITFVWGGLSLLVLNHFQFNSLQSFLAARGDIAYLWFMGALIVVYTLSPLLKAAYDKNPKLLLYFAIICAIFTFGNTLFNQLYTIFSASILHRTNIYYDLNFFWMFNPFQGIKGYVFVYFCLGGLLHHYQKQISQIPAKIRNFSAIAGIIVGMLGLFLISLLYSKTGGYTWDQVFNGYDTIFALILTLGVVLLALNYQAAKHPRLSRFFELVSRNTLGIYFIHVLPIFLTIGILREIPLLCNLGGTLLYGVIVFFVSLATSIIMRKIPVIRYLIS